MNDYKLMTYYQNNNVKTKLLTKKQLKEIDNRRLYALKSNDYNDIMDAKQKVIGIIDEEGLNNDDKTVKLKTALQILEYIIPKKKSQEITITQRKLEDIINESIEEAEIINTNNEAKDE